MVYKITYREDGPPDVEHWPDDDDEDVVDEDAEDAAVADAAEGYDPAEPWMEK